MTHPAHCHTASKSVRLSSFSSVVRPYSVRAALARFGVALPVDGARMLPGHLHHYLRHYVRRWEEDHATALPHPRIRDRLKVQSTSFEHRKVEAKLEDGDVRGALRLLESEETIAPYDDETQRALLQKHPPHPEPTDFLPALDPAAVAETRSRVKAFVPGSAGGLNSLPPQILKDLLSDRFSLLRALNSANASPNNSKSIARLGRGRPRRKPQRTM